MLPVTPPDADQTVNDAIAAMNRRGSGWLLLLRLLNVSVSARSAR